MIIYKITNKIDGKIYIGQTIQKLKRRWYSHCNGRVGLKTHIHLAIKKYGKENFLLEEIDNALNKEELNEKEIYWINFYDSLNPAKGYNLRTGGEKYVFTDEAKKKISDSKRGKLLSKEHKESLSKARIGKTHAPEVIDKIKKHHRKPEYREKCRIFMLGKKIAKKKLTNEN